MESASNKTYVSANMMQHYAKKKAERAQKKQASANMMMSGIPEEEENQLQNSMGTMGQAAEEVKLEEVMQPQQQMQPQPQQMMNMQSQLQAQPQQLQMQPQQMMQQQPQQKVEEKPKAKKSIFSGLFGSSKEAKSEKKDVKMELDNVDSEDDVRSVEDVDSDELDGDLNLSGEEDNSHVEQFRMQSKAKKMVESKRPARKFRQEIDTNIFKINFKALKDNAEIVSGDPIVCFKCGAIFNVNSIIENVKPENEGGVIGQQNEDDEEKQIWKCEFCAHENEVMIDDEEKPGNKAVNYILEAAAQVEDKKVMGAKDISVVFVMDQSGSMCVSQPIQGKHKLKGDKTKELQDLKKFGDGSDQFLQGERGVTYVSRMQCVQAAISQQIIDIGNGATDRKVGLVSFNDQVTVVGDGTEVPDIIGGDKLNDFDYLIKNGVENGQKRMTKTIKESYKKLNEQLMSLEETGPTALGPALLTGVAMAAEGAAGSQVVLCTDGLANIGIGSFDEVVDDEDLKKREEVYERIGEYAKSKGITVNIVSIIGDECNLETLSRIAELTGGEVERVDPISLTKNFANILSKPIIASNVVAKVLLHKGLQFRNVDPSLLSQNMSLMVKDIGNVNEDTEHMFEYTLKKISELIEMEDIDLTQIKAFPFQTQITYKALDGSKCVRVITELQEMSNDRSQVEQQANYDILGQNAIQQSANMARGGYTREAQAYAKNWGRMMRKNANTEEHRVMHKQFVENSRPVYELMQNQNMQEMAEEEEMDYGMAQNYNAQPQMLSMNAMPQQQKSSAFSGLFGGPSTVQRSQKSKKSDAYSAQLHQASKMSKGSFMKKK